MPAGLTLNTSTGTIGGTATVASVLTAYTVTVTDSAGATATDTIDITVNHPALTLALSSAAEVLTRGVAMTPVTSTPAGGSGTYSSYSIAPALPAGLTLNTSTGTIGGTATVASVLTAYTVTVTDSAGATATDTIDITVNHPALTLALSSAAEVLTRGVAMTPVTSTPAGGSGTYSSYSIAPALPAGLTLNTSTGTIGGTATVASVLTAYTVTVTDSAGATATDTIDITVNHPALTLALSSAAEVLTRGVAMTPVTSTPAGGSGTYSSYSIAPALPAGLTLNTSTGTIGGTATVASVLTAYTVTVTDSAGATATDTIDITVNHPALTLALSSAAEVLTRGVAMTPVTSTPAGGSGTYSSYSIAPALPAGLTLNTSTGTIGGTATVASVLTAYTVTVTDSAGATATDTIDITVNHPALTLALSSAAEVLTRGVAMTPVTSTPAGGSGTYSSYSIAPALPAGLTLNTSTGTIAGTATVASVLTAYTVTVTDSAGATATDTIDITVNHPALTLALSSAAEVLTRGVAMTPVTSTPAGGSGTYSSYSIAPALPAGLTLNTSTGTIGGTATVASVLTAYTVTVTDSAGATATDTIDITVNHPALTLALSSAAEVLTRGVAMTPVTSTPAGGSGTYSSYSIAPALPAGLTLNTSTGTIGGTATVASVLTAYTVTVTDSAGATATDTIDITVNHPALTLALSSAAEVLTRGVAMTPVTSTPAGGSGTYSSYSIAPALPAGLTLNTSTGTIGGTATVASVLTAYTVTVTDSAGATATDTIKFTVGQPTIVIAPDKLPDGDLRVAYSQTFAASGGTAPYTYAITSGALPPGLSLNGKSGVLNGTPTGFGKFTFTAMATDRFGSTGNRSYSLVIGTAFVEKRTREVIGNFVAHRADALTGNEPSRLRDFRRHRGTLFGSNGAGGAAATADNGSDASGPPVAFNVTPDADGKLSRLAFGTSLQKLMGAKRQSSESSASRSSERPDGAMALGASGSTVGQQQGNAPFDIWVEGYTTHFDEDNGGSSGNVGIMYLGADYEVLPGLMVGALMQFDFADEKSGLLGSSAEGHGWMAGPYLSARLTDNFFFYSRAAWGQSENSISPFGTYTDRVDGERWMARADLTGDWQWDRWRFSPTLGFAYFEEAIKSYTDSSGIRIDGQTYALGRMNFGPEIGYSIPLADGSTLEPMLSVQGIWDFEGANAVTFNEIPGGTPEFRAKVQAGVSLIAPWGYSIRGSGFVDGIGANDYKAYGGQIMINMPLN